MRIYLRRNASKRPHTAPPREGRSRVWFFARFDQVRLALTPPLAGPATLATASRRPSHFPTPRPRENPGALAESAAHTARPSRSQPDRSYIYFHHRPFYHIPGEVVNPILPSVPNLLKYFCNRHTSASAEDRYIFRVAGLSTQIIGAFTNTVALAGGKAPARLVAVLIEAAANSRGTSFHQAKATVFMRAGIR